MPVIVEPVRRQGGPTNFSGLEEFCVGVEGRLLCDGNGAALGHNFPNLRNTQGSLAILAHYRFATSFFRDAQHLSATQIWANHLNWH
jgi:hypothetical protein